jgi:hypothetical protein
MAWYEKAQITIINVGHRPTTITEIGMDVYDTRHPNTDWEPVPTNAMFSLDPQDMPFPVILKDGEQITLPLGGVLSDILIHSHMKAKVRVYDVEGHIYAKFEKRLYDPKWGRYDKMR